MVDKGRREGEEDTRSTDRGIVRANDRIDSILKLWRERVDDKIGGSSPKILSV